MRAAVFESPGQPLVIRDVPDPEPGPGDLVLRVQRCGICGTDLHLTAGPGLPGGTIPGHEYAGEVVELGSAVDRFRRGDVVTALPSTGCGRCEACRHDNVTLCMNAPGFIGGFGEYLVVPASTALPLRGGLSAADGALVEPLAVGRQAVRMAAIQPGERVLVLGAGSVALCTIFWLRRSGAARIAALSRSGRRASMATTMGADAFVTAGESEAAEVVDALGGPPDVVFECLGVPGSLARSIGHVRPFGRVLSMGFCMEPDPVVPAATGMKAVSLQFPTAYTWADFVHVVGEMDSGHVDPKVMISSVVTLDELPDAFEALRGTNGETKVQVAPAGP